MSFDTDRRVEELAGTSTPANTVRMNNFPYNLYNEWMAQNKTTVYFNHCNTIPL